MSNKRDWRCPKCLSLSGGDWHQCGGKCPLEMSPHYDAGTAMHHCHPVPYKTASGHEPVYTALADLSK